MKAKAMHELQTPSEKEAMVLANWHRIGIGVGVFGVSHVGVGTIAMTEKATCEGPVSQHLGITWQAAIARMSGLVRKGWLRTTQRNSGIWWQLTDAGKDAISFYCAHIEPA